MTERRENGPAESSGTVEWSTPKNVFQWLGSMAERGCHEPDPCVTGAPTGTEGMREGIRAQVSHSRPSDPGIVPAPGRVSMKAARDTRC